MSSRLVALNGWTVIMGLTFVLGHLMREWWPDRGYLLGVFVGVVLSICILRMVDGERTARTLRD